MIKNMCLGCLLAVGLMVSQVRGDDGQFKDLGPQITSTLLQGTTFTKDASGNVLMCTVIRGQPAKLLVFDLRDGKLLKRLPLEGSHGAWNACTASDGSVYVGTDDNGHLYRWVVGDEKAQDIGLVAPDQTFAWDVRPGSDGEVFVGTYKGCYVIRYHPKDGLSDIGHGAVAAGENYARSVSYDAASGKIYIGVGSHAHLIELDRKSGEKKDILPKEFAGYEFCYTVNFVGGKLFALPTSPPHGNVNAAPHAIVMDPATHQIEATLDSVQPQMVMSPLSPDGGSVYFNSDNRLAKYDFKSKHMEIVAPDQPMSILGMTWLADGKLAIAIRGGRISTYNVQSGELTSVTLDVPPEPTPIHSICLGPDGKIYTGGYLSGGLGSFDPKTEKHEQFGGLSQAESIGTLGNRLYFGIYPHARLTWFNTTKPWNTEQDNPHQFDHLDRMEQDRPIGIVGVEKLKKVFYGTVPDYGKLGGLLVTVDGATDAVETVGNVVRDQSIVSLTYANGYIIGGSAIAGGLGIEPKATDAELFMFDPITKQRDYELRMPGATLVSGLTVGPDNNVWGIADGVVFVFDPRERKILFSKKMFDVDVKARHAGWRDAMMVSHPSGKIYGTVANKFFVLEPKTKTVTVLRDHDASLIGMDRDGAVYFRDITHLWRYAP